MKRIILLAMVLTACSLITLAASPVAGTWDCVVYADMDYPFVLKIVEKEGALSGTAESDQVEAGPVENIKLEGNILTFSIDSPMAGVVDFKATLDGDTLKGTFDTYDFGGEFEGTRQK